MGLYGPVWGLTLAILAAAAIITQQEHMSSDGMTLSAFLELDYGRSEITVVIANLLGLNKAGDNL